MLRKMEVWSHAQCRLHTISVPFVGACVSIACFSVCLGLVWLLGRLDLNSGCVFGLTVGV
uniref:Uncharacterized protein n=1 Tax=Anguilla anguilla TaxID=7936 RepID=A0A0E9QTA6_ANGAN